MDISDPKRGIADGYDRMGEDFSDWNAARPQEGRRWFLGEVLAAMPEGCAVLELGCGPGTDAAALSSGRQYVGVDLSPVQLSIAHRRVPHAAFVVGDLASIAFRPATFDAVVAFYLFNHVPSAEVAPAFQAMSTWLRPGGRLFLGGLPTTADEDRVEDWLDVPMFFAGVQGEPYDRALRDAGFEIELSKIRYPIQESWGVNRPRWIIAAKPV
jgi:SAM-dependent methyltransferase